MAFYFTHNILSLSFIYFCIKKSKNKIIFLFKQKTEEKITTDSLYTIMSILIKRKRKRKQKIKNKKRNNRKGQSNEIDNDVVLWRWDDNGLNAIQQVDKQRIAGREKCHHKQKKRKKKRTFISLFVLTNVFVRGVYYLTPQTLLSPRIFYFKLLG